MPVDQWPDKEMLREMKRQMDTQYACTGAAFLTILIIIAVLVKLLDVRGAI